MKRLFASAICLAFLLLNTAAPAQDYGDDGKIDTFGGCQETVPPDIRAAIAAAATTQAHQMLAGEYEAARQGRTDENKTKVSVADMAKFEPTTSVLRPYVNTLAVDRIDYSVTGGDGTDRMVYCKANGTEVKLHLAPHMTQGHAQLTLRTPNNQWTVSEWLFLENGAWKVEHFTINPSSVGDTTPQMLADLGAKEAEAGRLFNAHILYRGALRYAYRGMSIRLDLTEDVTHDLSETLPLPEFADKPPYFWELRGNTYVAAQVAVAPLNGQMALSIAVGAGSNGDPIAHLHAFVDDLLAAHPEIRRVFPTIVVMAVEPGFDAQCVVMPDDVASRCTYPRAVYRVGKGFDKS